MAAAERMPYGSYGNGTLLGGLGDGTLYGEQGDDTFKGGEASDLLDSSPSADTCYVDDCHRLLLTQYTSPCVQAVKQP